MDTHKSCKRFVFYLDGYTHELGIVSRTPRNEREAFLSIRNRRKLLQRSQELDPMILLRRFLVGSKLGSTRSSRTRSEKPRLDDEQ
jgi:hypothetical protein